MDHNEIVRFLQTIDEELAKESSQGERLQIAVTHLHRPYHNEDNCRLKIHRKQHCIISIPTVKSCAKVQIALPKRHRDVLKWSRETAWANARLSRPGTNCGMRPPRPNGEYPRKRKEKKSREASVRKKYVC